MGLTTTETTTLFTSNDIECLLQHLRGRLPNEEDARDIAQEACLQMLQAVHVRVIENRRAYLFRIARNLMYQYYSRRRPTTNTAIDPDCLESSQPGLEDLTCLNTRQRMLERAMRELPAKCQRVLILRWRDGCNIKETARHMNLSVGMVKKYQANGLAHFRRRLKRYVAADQMTYQICRGGRDPKKS